MSSASSDSFSASPGSFSASPGSFSASPGSFSASLDSFSASPDLRKGKSGKIVKAKVRAKPMSGSKRARLHLPVGRIRKILRNGYFAPRIGISTPVILAAVLEYLASEVLELASEAATQNERRRIMPRHIMLAVRKDEELDRLLDNVIIPRAGVMPNIAKQLLPKKTRRTEVAESQDY